MKYSIYSNVSQTKVAIAGTLEDAIERANQEAVAWRMNAPGNVTLRVVYDGASKPSYTVESRPAK